MLTKPLPKNSDLPESKSPRSDMLKTNTLYSLTIAPNDAQQKFYAKNFNRLELINNHYRKLFKRFDMDGIESVMVPEITTPMGNKGRKPRYHFHGYISFKNIKGICKWYSIHWPGLLQNNVIELDTIGDLDVWKAYCFKNKEMMEAITDHLELNYPTWVSHDLK